MSEEFETNEIHTTFDFKGFLFKLLRYWPLFVFSLALALGIAYYINIRKLPVYSVASLISIKDDQNPFFTSTTSLTFNWGGTTDKVNTAIITLKSRSHNEKVVDRLQYYLNYRRDGKYQKVDAYKRTPFMVQVDTTKPQILGKELKVIFLDSANFTLETQFTGGNVQLQYYNDSEEREKVMLFREAEDFKKQFQLGENINLPFFSGVLLPVEDIPVRTDIPYYLSFSNFDSTVRGYSNITINPEGKGSSVLQLSKTGFNKAKIVDFLNTSAQVLSEDMLERKNLFATKTIRFIDSSLSIKSRELENVENELNAFKNKNSIFDLNAEGAEVNAKLNQLDLQKEAVNRQINYLISLKTI